MYKRLNITLPECVLDRADAYAKRERYTRSALIAVALEAYVGTDETTAGIAREAPAVYAPDAVGLNPAIAPLVPGIVNACRAHGVVFAALVGSSTQPDPAIVPRDLDLLVRFVPGWEGQSARYFELIDALESLTGREVDLVEIDAVKNPYLIDEFERTKMVIYEAS